jgi:NAD(P)-dependent dehydrogenase (short-subunit alcohol dehydrogenase family)
MGSLADQSDPDSQYYEVIEPAYQASKTALNTITVAVSKLLRDTAIKVNSVCPGWVQADLGGPENHAAAPLTPEEAAPIIVEMALIADDGPSGEFVDRDGPVPW